MLGKIASRLAALRGYELVPKRREPTYPTDFTAEEIATWQAVQPYTMTSPERVVTLTRAVAHIIRYAIPGDFVECGVWKGGSMMAAARTLLELGDTSRTLHLFDTFEGMPAPSELDFRIKYGQHSKSAAEILAAQDKATSHTWAVAALDLVRRNMQSTGYPREGVRYVRGRVEETIPLEAPDRIALLRLDTDWYESTQHEMVHLYPRLVPGGVLILDDYGHWAGVERAVDEYVADHRIQLLLCRIDYPGRVAVKPPC